MGKPEKNVKLKMCEKDNETMLCDHLYIITFIYFQGTPES